MHWRRAILIGWFIIYMAPAGQRPKLTQLGPYPTKTACEEAYSWLHLEGRPGWKLSMIKKERRISPCIGADDPNATAPMSPPSGS